MTRVWRALWPPWKRTTMSACSDNQSTILPFPSSPHWAPTTTTLAISQVFPLQLGSLKHDLRPNGTACPEGKPPPFPDHAACTPQARTRPEPLACDATNRIKDAGYRPKQ